MMSNKQIKLRLRILFTVICIAGISSFFHWVETEVFKPAQIEFPIQFNKE